MMNPVAAMIQPAVYAVPLAVEPVLDTVTLAVQAPLDPIPLAIQTLGQALAAMGIGPRRPAIEAPIDEVTAPVQALIDAFALAIQAVIDAIPQVPAGQRVGKGGAGPEARSQAEQNGDQKGLFHASVSRGLRLTLFNAHPGKGLTDTETP